MRARIEVLRYKPFAPGSCIEPKAIGSVDAVLDGQILEPLFVVHDADGELTVVRSDTLTVADGSTCDLRPFQTGMRLDDERITSILREFLVDAVRRAVRNHVPRIDVQLDRSPPELIQTKNIVAVATARIDGRMVEPLVVLREANGSLRVVGVQGLIVGGALLVDTSGYADMHLASLTSDLWVRLRAAVLARLEATP